MRYSRRTSNYLKIIIVFGLTHMMNMVDLIIIGLTIVVVISKIDSGYFLEKEFIELIYMNF